MNLTSRSRYALKIMMDLARYGASQPLVRRSEIASRQGIPTDYLDQIMVKLRSGHLVESIRGRSGGYRLARPADQISMWDLFSSVEESMIPVECISSGRACDFEASCSSRDAWYSIYGALKASLSGIKLGTLASHWVGEVPLPSGLLLDEASSEPVQECRGGGRREALDSGVMRRSLNSGLKVGVDLDG